MSWFHAFAMATRKFYKSFSKSKEKSPEVIPEKPFPRFRATVDEGLGIVNDGVIEYYCNICLQTIISHRHHLIQCQDYDVCEQCLLNNIDILSEYQIRTTLRNEQLAEYKEINYLVQKIISSYYQQYINIMTDFNAFLLLCRLKKHQNFSQAHVPQWLSSFNSYTLNLFTLSEYYKKRSYRPLPKYTCYLSSSTY